MLEIVQTSFAPSDVEHAVADLLSEPTWEAMGLYVAVIGSLRNLHGILAGSPRSVTMIATEVAKMSGFEGVEESQIYRAVSDIASASRGALLVRDGGVVVLNVDYDELERRVQSLTGQPSSPQTQRCLLVGQTRSKLERGSPLDCTPPSSSSRERSLLGSS